MMDFNFSSYSGANFPNFMVESSLIRIEDEDIEVLRKTFLQNNPNPIDRFDEMLLEICIKNLAITKSENDHKENKEKQKNNSNNNNNNLNSKDENLFRIKFNQNFLITNHLREIDLYNYTNTYVSTEKNEFRFQNQKGFQFKNLKKIYVKTKDDNNKNESESESQDLTSIKKSGIFDNYTTNDHDKFFDANVINPKHKNSIKQTNSVSNNRKNSGSHGYRSSLSILTKKNDFVKGSEPQIDIKTIMEHQVFRFILILEF